MSHCNLTGTSDSLRHAVEEGQDDADSRRTSLRLESIADTDSHVLPDVCFFLGPSINHIQFVDEDSTIKEPTFGLQFQLSNAYPR